MPYNVIVWASSRVIPAQSRVLRSLRQLVELVQISSPMDDFVPSEHSLQGFHCGSTRSFFRTIGG